MKIKCKVADSDCPKGLNICCSVCKHKATCKRCCYTVGWIADLHDCENAEFEGGADNV